MLAPKETALEACRTGIQKVKRNSVIIFVSAILGGLFIALGFYGYIVASSGFVETNYRILGTFLGAMVFPVGLVLIVITGVDLYTGNCLIFFGWLNKSYHFGAVIKNLLIVFFGNLLGSFVLVLLIYFSGLIETDTIKEFIVNVSVNKTNLTFIQGLTRGILCNIAVVLAVYMSYAAKTVGGKTLAAFYPVFLFVLSGYEHSVANMFILPLGYMIQTGSEITFIGMINNFISVTLGNFIGGALLIPIPYYYLFVKKR